MRRGRRGLVRQFQRGADDVAGVRGFWIQDQGERLFVLINESGPEAPDINQGQSLRLPEAVVYTSVQNLPGSLQEQARNIAQAQPVVLAVDSRSVQIVGTSTP